MQAADAAVGGIGAALDQRAGFQPVYQAADRDRLDFADSRHFVLRRYAGLAGQPRQNHPLCPRHPEHPGTLVEPRPAQPGDVVQHNHQVTF